MVIETLVSKQKELRMSDEEFAVILGISRQLWNFTKNGKQPIGTTFIYAVLKTFPELKDDLANFLLENANQLAENTNLLAKSEKAS